MHEPAAWDVEEITPNLAALLRQHRAEIAAAWVECIRQLPDSPWRERPAEHLHALVERMLEAMAEATATGSYVRLEAFLAETFRPHLQVGFDAANVIEALLLGKDAALPTIWRVYPPGSGAARQAIARLDACLRQVVFSLVQSSIATAERRRAKQLERTATMLRVVQAALGVLDLDEALQRIREEIASVVPGSTCAFYLIDEGRFVPSPSPPPQHPRLVDGFIREIVTEKKPLASYDAASDPRVMEEMVRWAGFKSSLGVPLILRGRVLAVVIVMTTEKFHAFTSEEIELVQGMANAAALIVENARLYQQARQVAILEERERLAGEMHDNLAQALGYLNLGLSGVDRLLADGQVEEARLNLAELKQVTKQTYTDVREAIFNLRIRSDPRSLFLPTLREYLVEYQNRYKVRVELLVENERLTEFSSNMRIQILRIIQESLTNVRKHAGTDRAQIRIEQEASRVRITVEDDGRGFDPAQVAEKGRHYFGLEIMRERAESVGGSMELDSRPGQGTRVIIRMPLVAGGGT
ncbi:MAG: GAF domain-containing sensor histidine kinase [Anaerolineae bacterium]